MVGRQIGSMRILEMLSTGGMGAVYVGYDDTLQRRVAVKALHERFRLGTEARERFLHEARVLSRLNHPSVCTIHDYIEGDDCDLLVLELIEGQSLRRLLETEMEDEQRWKVAHGLVEAMVVMHGAGVVHRDLKPENVMVTGQGVVKLLDFGIAHLVRDELVAAGDEREPGAALDDVVVGTLGYMSPEQARGEATTAASDIFNLGLILQELFSGSRAMELGATPLATLRMAMEGRTVPVGGVDPDLANLIERMKSRAPGHRPSTVDVAERLGLIMEKPRRRRRRRIVAAVTAVVLVLVSASLGLWQRERRRTRTVAALAQSFGEEVWTAEWMLRVVHMRPRHDIREERAEVVRRLAALEQRMAELGDVATGPGGYALGRGYLALGDPATARVHLERAWQSGYRNPEVASALGQALSSLYREELAKVQGVRSEQERKHLRVLIEREYRDPALLLLQDAAAGQAEDGLLIEALIAFCEDRLETALAKAREASTVAPWLHAAMKLEAEIWVIIGDDAWHRGDVDGAMAAYERAGDVLARAIDHARSDPSLYEGDCHRQLRVMEVARLSGGSFDEPLGRAVAACGDALKVDPDAAGVHGALARAHWWAAEYELEFGRDPAELLQRAVTSAERAIELAEDSAEAWRHLGDTMATVGLAAGKFGADPRPAFGRAVEGYERSIELGVPTASSFNNLGTALVEVASWGRDHGSDPLPLLDRAIQAYSQAIELSPRHPYPRTNLGNAWLQRARAEAALGGNPQDSAFRAFESFENALHINERIPLTHIGISETAGVLAQWRMRAGENAAELIERARATAKEGLRLDPENPSGVLALGRALAVEAQHRLHHGEHPTGSLDRARAELQRMLELNPRSTEARRVLAEVELLAARWDSRRGVTPGRRFRQAETWVESAVELDPGNAALRGLLAEVCWESAAWQASQGRTPKDAVSRGLTAADESLAVNPAAPKVLAVRGALRLLAGGHLQAAGVRDLEEALATDPLLAERFGPVLDRVGTGSRTDDP